MAEEGGGAVHVTERWLRDAMTDRRLRSARHHRITGSKINHRPSSIKEG
jgi:hypothetical protein